MALVIHDEDYKSTSPAPKGMFAALIMPRAETKPRGFVAMPEQASTAMLFCVAEFLKVDIHTARAAYNLFLYRAPALGRDHESG